MRFIREIEALGSRISLEIITDDVRTAEIKSRQFFDVIRGLEKKYSRFDDNSVLSKLNKSLNEWVNIDGEFYALLKLAEQLLLKTNGYFDIGMEKVLSGLGYDKDYSFRATADKFSFDSSFELKKGSQVRITTPIELGGLIKGHVLDLGADIFRDFENVCVDGGGDIWLKGHNHEGKPWKILFEHPSDETMAFGSVSSTRLFLAGSSPNKRKWSSIAGTNTRQHHHLINPKEKQPARQMSAVFTQSSSGLMADAMATALFVMGYENAKGYLGTHKEFEALLISPEGKMFKTEGFQGEFWS